MKLSNKTEYGIRALVHLAECGGGQPYCISEIADKEGISQSFLEKIFSELKNAGIVASQRGSRGGYILAQAIEEISLKDIIQVLEGDTTPFQGLVDQDSAPKVHCKSHFVLAITQQKIMDSLHQVRLSDIVNL